MYSKQMNSTEKKKIEQTKEERDVRLEFYRRIKIEFFLENNNEDEIHTHDKSFTEETCKSHQNDLN